MTVDLLKKFYLCHLDIDLGRRLSLSKSTISKWRKFGIPEDTQAIFEVQTKGFLKAKLSNYSSLKATEAELTINNKSIKNK